MANASPAIPDGFHAVTPHIMVSGAADAIEFYKRAFGAEEMMRMPMPGDPSKLMHAAIRIGDSIVMIADEFAGCAAPASDGAAAQVTLHLYVADADATITQAVAAGAKVTMPAADMFWGDRYGQVVDPFGHRWSVATHQHDYTPEEMMQGAAAAFAAHAAAEAAKG